MRKKMRKARQLKIMENLVKKVIKVKMCQLKVATLGEAYNFNRKLQNH